jgi:ribosome-associated heat shock protein Hsp15
MQRGTDAMTSDGERVRFDKWLWAARFYKTRTLAAEAVDAGQARVGEERVKPARTMHVGDRVTVRRQGLVWDIEVLALSDRRGGAVEAAKLYRETAEGLKAREERIRELQAARAAQPLYPGRPTKKQRRKLEDFLNEP